MPNDWKVKNILDKKYNLYQHVEEIKSETGVPRGEYRAFLTRTRAERDKRLEDIYHSLGL